MRFMLIHCVPDSVANRLDLDPQTESELYAWLEEMRGRGVLLDGDRLLPVATARTVQLRAGEVLIAGGPFAETKEQVAGYDVIDCANADEALEIASKHPTARLGTIEIRPVFGG